MGYWDQTLSPHYGPTRTWNMPTGHQLNSSLWLEVEVLTSLFLLEAWLLPGEQGGEGDTGWLGLRAQPACCGQGAGPESPSIFSRAWPAQPTAAGPLALGLRSVYSSICLVALGTVGPPCLSQSPNLSFHH